MAGLCQDCDACCRVFEVDSVSGDPIPVHKAFNQPCKFLGQTQHGPGCTIYNERPIACNHYICLWLDSQRRDDISTMSEALKPNACKVVMGWPWGEDRETLYVYPLPGYENNWRYPPVADHLRMILGRGGKVVVLVSGKRIVLRGDMAVIGTEEEFEKLLT